MFVLCLLLGITPIKAIVIPVSHDSLQLGGLEATRISPESVNELTPDTRRALQHLFPRAGSMRLRPAAPKPVRPADLSNPGDPPPRLNPEDPKNLDTPPEVRPNPGDPVAPSGGKNAQHQGPPIPSILVTPPRLSG